MSTRLGLPGVLFALLALTSPAWAGRVETANGLRLELSDRGRVTGLSIGPTSLPLASPGGLAIADFNSHAYPHGQSYTDKDAHPYKTAHTHPSTHGRSATAGGDQ